MPVRIANQRPGSLPQEIRATAGEVGGFCIAVRSAIAQELQP